MRLIMRLIWPMLIMLAFTALLAFAIYMLALPDRHLYARDLGQWTNEPATVRDWYERAVLTKEAQKRLGFVGCCKYADVVKTKFRVDTSSGAAHWFYLDPKSGQFEQIPDDIIHWTEQAPDNQPTLFALSEPFGQWPVGTLTCFYPSGGAI